MRRDVILGIDALEYDYAVKFKQFTLRTYGKVFIPKELWLNGVPYTPLVWTAYLTGKKPSEVDVSHVYETPSWFKKLLEKWTQR